MAKVPIAIAMVSLGSCAPTPVEDSVENFARFSPIAAEIAKGRDVRLYEGLPHETFEGDLLDKELKRKDIQKLNGFWYYKGPLQFQGDDADRLTELMLEHGSFEPFSGEKICGVYHPDYGLEWQTASGPVRCMICFGCDEAMFFSASSELRCDIDRDTADRFAEILGKYKVNRPGDRNIGLHGLQKD